MHFPLAWRRIGWGFCYGGVGQPKRKTLPFDNIIYLAAACPIRQYEEAVLPYLRKNKRARFFNLMLGASAGLNDGIGAPESRVFASVVFGF